MQTNTCETIIDEEPRYDLTQWRADAQALAEEICANKRAMRAGCKAEQSAAQAAAHPLARRATAFYLFRATLRGREHAPGLDLKRLWEITRAVHRGPRHAVIIYDTLSEQRETIIKMIGAEYARG